MLLFLQFNLGGISWGLGSFVLFEVSSLDGGLGIGGNRVDSVDNGEGRDSADDGDGGSLNYGSICRVDWGMVGHGSDDIMLLFLQFNLGGISWGLGGFILFEVSSLDGGLGVGGNREDSVDKGDGRDSADDGDGGGLNYGGISRGDWGMIGQGSDDFVFLFFQFDLGGSSWGHGSFVLFEVSSLDGRLGQDGIRVGEETALLALFGGGSGGGGGFVVEFEEFRTGSNNLGSVFNGDGCVSSGSLSSWSLRRGNLSSGFVRFR